MPDADLSAEQRRRLGQVYALLLQIAEQKQSSGSSDPTTEVSDDDAAQEAHKGHALATTNGEPA